MELSIVICTYNRSSFAKGLETIVQQRLAFIDVPIELIVLDNNSSDDTSSVLKNSKMSFQYKFGLLFGKATRT